MNKCCFIAVLITISLIGCAEPGNSNAHNGAVIYVGRNSSEVVITMRRFKGIVGPDGFVGFRDLHYSAKLDGTGPVYAHPDFVDDLHYPCIGSIYVDWEHDRVTVNMRRVVKETAGEVQQTKEHPANGTYSIKSVIKLTPEQDELLFKAWRKSGE
jgi:hypothetical protein